MNRPSHTPFGLPIAYSAEEAQVFADFGRAYVRAEDVQASAPAEAPSKQSLHVVTSDEEESVFLAFDKVSGVDYIREDAATEAHAWADEVMSKAQTEAAPARIAAADIAARAAAQIATRGANEPTPEQRARLAELAGHRPHLQRPRKVGLVQDGR